MTACHHLSAGQLATLACLTEFTATKPGNVHRAADFEDMTFLDMATAAVAIHPAMERATPDVGIGKTVFDAITATQDAVGKNTNLGTVLLFAPLAIAVNQLGKRAGNDSENARRDPGDLREAVRKILASTKAEDSRLVYEAIRLAKPGGLGEVNDSDIQSEAPSDLIHAMRLAEDRDLVARQYTTDFATVFDQIVPGIRIRMSKSMPSEQAIIATFVSLMASHPDSLIARKCGDSIAQESSIRAQKVADLENSDGESWLRELAELDFWLRSDGHRRNPGTSADLIAAGIFVALWSGERFV